MEKSSFDMLTDSSESLLRDTVYQLLIHSQNLDATVEEASSLKAFVSEQSFLGNLTEISCLPVLKCQSQLSEYDLSIYGADICANKIIACLQKNKHETCLSEENQNELKVVTKLVHQLIKDGNFQLARFHDILGREAWLPIDMLWILHSEGVYSVHQYLQRPFQKSGFVDRFVEEMSAMASEDCSLKSLAGLMTEMIIFGYSEDSRKDVTNDRESVCAMLDKLVLAMIENDQQTTSGFMKSLASVTVDIEKLKRVYWHFLTLVLSHKPVLKVSHAIRDQCNWTYGKLSPNLRLFYRQILLPFSVEDVLRLLRQVFNELEVNWQYLLSLVSVTIVCMPESSKLFLGFINNLLQEGIDICDIEMTIMAMLLARQSCFQGPHVFMSYADWFQRTFSDGSRSFANSKKSFTFLMKFLTDLMPYELGEHIREHFNITIMTYFDPHIWPWHVLNKHVHILRPPSVPVKCRQLLSDYITLAKTRLEDLKMSLDVPGVDDSSVLDQHKAQLQLESDVESAINMFEATGKIPTSIMEASIFRKPYYIRQFLPTLLKPRPLPDVPDSKMQLISALKRADKIQSSMYNSYEKACKMETAELFKGVFVDLDSDDDMSMSTTDQLKKSLEVLLDTVRIDCGKRTEIKQKNTCTEAEFTVTEALSKVCEKVENCLNISGNSGVEQTLYIDIDCGHTGIEEKYIQVVDILLNYIMKGLQASYCSECPNFVWFQSLLKSLSQYRQVLEAIYKRLWSLTIKQGLSLETHHIESIAAILVEIQFLGGQLPAIYIKNVCNTCQKEKCSFTENIYKSLPVNNCKWMTCSLRLTAAYLKYMFSTHEDCLEVLAVKSVVNKFLYLATRLKPELRYCNNDAHVSMKTVELATAIYLSEVFQTLKNKLTFNDWCEFESSLNPQQDALTDFERYEYYTWVVYQYFLPRLSKNDTPMVYQYLASAVLEALLITGCRANNFHSCCTKCSPVNRDSLPVNKCHMMGLLQELTSMFRIEKCENINTLPWLPKQLTIHLQYIGDDIQKENCVKQFFRMCLCLPAYLMFTDVSQTLAPETSTLTSVIDFINETMVQHLNDGLYLPASMAAYLAQGLLQSSLVGKYSALLSTMCSKSYVFTISLLVNFQAVYPFLEFEMKNDFSEISQLFSCLKQRSLKSFQAKEHWLCACAILGLILQPGHLCFESTMPDIGNSEVGEVLSEMVLLQLAYVTNFTEPQNSGHANKLMSSLTWLLKVSHGCSILHHLLTGLIDKQTCSCLKKTVLDVKDITLLRYLKMEYSAQDLSQQLNVEAVSGLLQTYINIGDLLETAESDKCNKVQNYVEFSNFIKDVVLCTSPNLLRHLSQDTVLRCGPLIADTLIYRMSS